jgi:type VI secretion system secreted protein Hcp
MASDVYLSIDGVKGESQDSDHKDWIEILSYSGATVPPASATAKAAATEQAGVSQHGNLAVTKHVDSTSPKLQALVSSGKHNQAGHD